MPFYHFFIEFISDNRSEYAYEVNRTEEVLGILAQIESKIPEIRFDGRTIYPKRIRRYRIYLSESRFSHESSRLHQLYPGGYQDNFSGYEITRDSLSKVELTNYVKKIKGDAVAIAMFDLSGSTKIKLTEGHSKGIQLALEHNNICEKIAKQYEGTTIKHMGDGIFIEFMSPIKACHASLNIKKTIVENGRFSTKGGITLGVVESMKMGGSIDLLGSTIDRCARLVSEAIPNQILIDEAVYIASESLLKDSKDVIISKPSIVTAKGIGELTVYELSIKSLGFTGFGLSHMNVIEEGRMPLNEKNSFMLSAEEDIVELGIGLSSFSDNYFRQRSTEWKDILTSLLKKGVIIKCIILNPESETARVYVKDNKEPQYLKRMDESLTKLKTIKKEFQGKGLNNFKIFMYNSIPRFHASCIDINKKQGKMSVSHYLPEIPRSENPVIQFSNYSNPILFKKYRSVIQNILANATEVDTS